MKKVYVLAITALMIIGAVCLWRELSTRRTAKPIAVSEQEDKTPAAQVELSKVSQPADPVGNAVSVPADDVRLADVPVKLQDMVTWKPSPTKAVLREVLDSSVYEQDFKDALKNIDEKALLDKAPAHGVVIAEVVPQGQAAKLGLKPGDYITRIGNVEIMSVGMVEPARTNTLSTMGIWSQEKGAVEYPLQPGRIGASLSNAFPINRIYLQSKERNPKWDSHVLVAATYATTNPDLAETALFHAQEAGYDGALLYALAAQIAFHQHRMEQVMAYGPRGLEAIPDSWRDPMIGMLITGALATHRFEYADKLASDLPEDFGHGRYVLRETLARCKAGSPLTYANPIAEVANCKRVDLMAQLRGVTPDEYGVNEPAAKSLRDGEKLSFEIEAGHYYMYRFKPGATDVEMSAAFRFHATDTIVTQWSRALAFGLYDLTDPDQQELLKIYLDVNGSITVQPDSNPNYYSLPMRSDHTWADPQIGGVIHIAVVNRTCEIVVDGRRVFLSPLLGDGQGHEIGLYIQPVGITGYVDRFGLSKLERK